MNILHINTYDVGGGAGNIAFELANYHASEIKQSYLVGEKRSMLSYVSTIPKNSRYRIFNYIADRISQRVVHKNFREMISAQDKWHGTYSIISKLPCYQHADIIHLHNIHGGYFDLSALEPMAEEKPIVWTLHDMWALTGGEAHTFGRENYQRGVPEVFGKEFYPLFNPLIDRRNYYLNYKKELYYKIADRITFVTCSNWLEACMRKSYVYNKKLQVKTIHNGIDTGIFKVIKVREREIPTVLFFNSDDPFKGCEIFRRIINKINVSYNLVVVGKKPELPVTFEYLPYIDNQIELRDLFNEVDVLIFPSIAETFPLITLQAMACGVCVIASNVGGIPEQINNNDTGLLFKTNNDWALIKIINTCLNKSDEIKRIGKTASEVVKNNFTLNQMHKEYFELYERIRNK